MNGKLGLWSQSETVNCFECKTITFILGSEDQGSPKKARQNKTKKRILEPFTTILEYTCPRTLKQ